MSKPILIILSLVLGLVIFIIGGGMGIVYQSQIQPEKTANQENVKEMVVNVTDKDCVSLVKALSSSVITSIAAHGTVVNMEGNNITLKTNKDSVIFTLSDNTQVSSFSFPASYGNETEKIANPANSTVQNKSIKDIKIGDVLNIDVDILSDGSLEIKTATIINSK